MGPNTQTHSTAHIFYTNCKKMNHFWARSSPHLWQIFSWPATCGSGFPQAPRPGQTVTSLSPQTGAPGWVGDHGGPPGTASWHTGSLNLTHTHTHHKYWNSKIPGFKKAAGASKPFLNLVWNLFFDQNLAKKKKKRHSCHCCCTSSVK